MGIYDRDYNRPQSNQTYYSMGSGFRGIPPVVKWLLIINFSIFLIANLIPNLGKYIYYYGSVLPESFANMIQVWRLLTYQFLHDPASIWHIVFNMMVLYFMGPFVERAWGSKAFLKFYLISGAAGGVVYTLLVLLGMLQAGPMVGASGAIYGVVAAIAVMYPRMKVLLYGIIPMTMVWLVVLVVIMSFLNIASGKNAGGEAAHLTGLAVGFLYMKYKPWITQRRMERQKGAWAKKVERERNFQSEVDRTLDKVRREGINSLSNSEKKILQEATHREQENQ
ncbi:MAG: rhomboid family intramembrane serine protease [Planctomycetes bacterium]|nr:rhomboid family intramembrane serine protease [Planctomycetota bacterium]